MILRTISLWAMALFIMLLPFAGISSDTLDYVRKVAAQPQQHSRNVGPVSSTTELAGDVIQQGKNEFLIKFHTEAPGELNLTMSTSQTCTLYLSSADGVQVAGPLVSKGEQNFAIPDLQPGTYYLKISRDNSENTMSFTASFTLR